MAKVRCA